MKKLACLSALLAIAGCATASRDISAAYVPPEQYASYDCGQLAAESGRVQSRTHELAGRLDKAAENDKALVAASLLFLPTLFAIGGKKDEEAEYGRLKGESDALRQQASRRGCAVSRG